MTSRRQYWCPKTMKRQPCWCPKPILWELNSLLMQMLSFVPINLHRCWPREWKHSIRTIYQVMGLKQCIKVIKYAHQEKSSIWIHNCSINFDYCFVYFFHRTCSWFVCQMPTPVSWLIRLVMLPSRRNWWLFLTPRYAIIELFALLKTHSYPIVG